MLGHELFTCLGATHDVHVTLRQPVGTYRRLPGVSAQNATGGIEASDWPQLSQFIRQFRPDAVINCIGIVKQRKDAKSAIPSLEINSLLPHRLNEVCGEM